MKEKKQNRNKTKKIEIEDKMNVVKKLNVHLRVLWKVQKLELIMKLRRWKIMHFRNVGVGN